MSQRNQVREVSGIQKIMEAIKLAIRELVVNEEVVNNIEFEKELEDIIAKQDMKRLDSLQEQITNVYIPLEDNGKNIVEKVHVSEKQAQVQADIVEEVKRGRKKDFQKQREE